MLRYAFVFRGHQGFRDDRRNDRLARRAHTVCATESDLARRQIAVGYDRQIATVVPKDSENLVGKVGFGWQPEPTGERPVLPGIFEFVFIRVDS
jgi:hypothetical protein